MGDACADLAMRTSFPAYVQLMRNLTGDAGLTVNALGPCRRQICSVLYGAGNPDISGIGVIIGYFTEVLLGVFLAVAVTTLQKKDAKRSVPCAFHRAFGVYADAAVLLTLSIQLAAMIILIQKDFGISADNFGSLEVEVTWAVALLTMLPMLLVINLGVELDRQELRLGVICLTWVLFLVTFMSRTISAFGPGQIGSSGVISQTEIANVEQLCWSGPAGLSRTENIAFDVFAIGGSILLSIVLIGTLVWTILVRQKPDLAERWRRSTNVTPRFLKVAKLCLILNVLIWGIPQLWAILNFRSAQQQLAISVGAADQDNTWSFGQIIAVVVFLPVFIEFGYVYLNGSPKIEQEAAEQEK